LLSASDKAIWNEKASKTDIATKLEALQAAGKTPILSSGHSTLSAGPPMRQIRVLFAFGSLVMRNPAGKILLDRQAFGLQFRIILIKRV
jgi:hypothetical protein